MDFAIQSITRDNKAPNQETKLERLVEYLQDTPYLTLKTTLRDFAWDDRYFGDSFVSIPKDFASEVEAIKAMYTFGTAGRYDAQRGEWDRNSNHFDFLSLPGEVRNLIYAYYFDGYIYPLRLRRGTNNAREGVVLEPESFGALMAKDYIGPNSTYARATIDWYLPDAINPFNLFLVCKQVYEETKLLPFRYSEFRFHTIYKTLPHEAMIDHTLHTVHGDPPCKSLMHLLFHNPIPWDHRGSLRRVSLQPNRQVFDQLGGLYVTPRGILYNTRGKAIHLEGCIAPSYFKFILDQFPNISQFEIRVPHGKGLEEEPRSLLLCNRVRNSMVLWNLRTHVCHIRNVNITGCISPELAACYHQLLDDLRNGRSSTNPEADIIGEHIVFGVLQWQAVMSDINHAFAGSGCGRIKDHKDCSGGCHGKMGCVSLL